MRNPSLAFAAACLLGALAFGLLSAVVVAFPADALEWLPFERLRPVHTLLALAWIIPGALAAVQGYLGRPPGPVQTALFVVAVLGSAASVLAGVYSGREYLSWSPWWSLPWFAGMVLGGWAVLKELPRLLRQHPDSAWMLGLGALLVPLAFAEAHLYLLPAVGLDVGRDLAIQWHAVDTMIGGWNVLLYGASAMLVLQHKAPRAWAGWLFAASVAGLLLTYGHHHYASPQPLFLKNLAFAGSLLAGVHFVWHGRGWLRGGEANTLEQSLMRGAQGWTLYAIGSGFLMALPPVNALLHGTTMVVSHAMAAMIGVNTLLILALGFRVHPAQNEPAMVRAVRATNALLVVMVLLFIVAGAAEGALRTAQPFEELRDTVELLLLPLPLVGLGLVGSLGMLAWGLSRSALTNRSGQAAGTINRTSPSA